MLGGLLILLTRQPFPSVSQLAGIAPHMYVGGFLGAFFVTNVILPVHRLNVAKMFALLVTGQLAVAFLYYHFGALGVRQNPITPAGEAGVLFLIPGAYLINILGPYLINKK